MNTTAKICFECENNFILSKSDSVCDKKIIEPIARGFGTTIAVVTTSSTAAVIAATTISATSSATAWIMVNQYQLLLTTPTLETGLPDELLAFMEEFQIFTLSFNFFRGWKWPEFEKFIENFDFEQTVNGLKTIGYDSGSIIVNEYNFFKTLITFIVWNLLFLVLYFSLKKYKENKFIKIVIKSIGGFFMYTVYVRLIIEAFSFILINSLSEIVVNATDIQEVFSFVVAILTTIFFLSIPIFLLLHYYKYRKISNLAEDGKFTELYDGFKPKAICQLYNCIF